MSHTGIEAIDFLHWSLVTKGLRRILARNKTISMLPIVPSHTYTAHLPDRSAGHPTAKQDEPKKLQSERKRSHATTPSLGQRMKSLLVATLLIPHMQPFAVASRRLCADTPSPSETETQILGALVARDSATADAANRSLAYLRGHDEFDAMLDRLVAGVEPIMLESAVHLDANTATAFSDTIMWDPSSKLAAANETDAQGHVRCVESSAAMNLGHELRHAHWNFQNHLGQQLLLGLMHPSFDNFEERRVVLLTNNHSAAFGEGTRINHVGDFFPADAVDDHSGESCRGLVLPNENRRITALFESASAFQGFQATPLRERAYLAATLASSKKWPEIQNVFQENDDAIASLRNATEGGSGLLAFDTTFADHVTRATALAESL